MAIHRRCGHYGGAVHPGINIPSVPGDEGNINLHTAGIQDNARIVATRLLAMALPELLGLNLLEPAKMHLCMHV